MSADETALVYIAIKDMLGLGVENYMMSFRVAIVEDDDAVAQVFEQYIARYADENGGVFLVSRFSDGAEIVSDYKPVYDIIFMDIEMKQMDGMTAAQKIRELDNNVLLIFITNMSQYAIKGYSVNALDYLLKPVQYFVFSEQLKKSIETLQKRRPGFLLLPLKDGAVNIETSKIIYIESFKHQMTVYTKDGIYSLNHTMKKLEDELSGSSFFRCNNCYLVNLAYVRVISGLTLTVDKYTLTISRPRKKEFIKALNAYTRTGGVIL